MPTRRLLCEFAPRCRCTPDEAAHFIASLPESRHLDSTSPWHGYLQAVYGDAPPPQLQLSSFEFFFHRHSRWPLSVAWPMARCESMAVGGHRLHRTIEGPLCDDATCARWLRPGAAPAPTADDIAQSRYSAECNARDHACVQVQILPTVDGGSLGTLISDKVNQGAQRMRWYGKQASVPKPTAAQLQPPIGREDSKACAEPLVALSTVTLRGRGQFCAGEDGGLPEWIEVTRASDAHAMFEKVNAGEQREGHNGYACWYFPARGSGVFLRLGRTRLLYRKDKTQPGSGMSQLEDAWRKRLKLSVAMDSLQQMSVTRAWPRSNITRLKGSTGGGRAESFPLLAADLGYDSVLCCTTI